MAESKCLLTAKPLPCMETGKQESTSSSSLATLTLPVHLIFIYVHVPNIIHDLHACCCIVNSAFHQSIYISIHLPIVPPSLPAVGPVLPTSPPPPMHAVMHFITFSVNVKAEGTY